MKYYKITLKDGFEFETIPLIIHLKHFLLQKK